MQRAGAHQLEQAVAQRGIVVPRALRRVRRDGHGHVRHAPPRRPCRAVRRAHGGKLVYLPGERRGRRRGIRCVLRRPQAGQLFHGQGLPRQQPDGKAQPARLVLPHRRAGHGRTVHGHAHLLRRGDGRAFRIVEHGGQRPVAHRAPHDVIAAGLDRQRLAAELIKIAHIAVEHGAQTDLHRRALGRQCDLLSQPVLLHKVGKTDKAHGQPSAARRGIVVAASVLARQQRQRLLLRRSFRDTVHRFAVRRQAQTQDVDQVAQRAGLALPRVGIAAPKNISGVDAAVADRDGGVLLEEAAHAEITVADGEQGVPPLPPLRIEAAHGQRMFRVAHRERILCVLHSHPSFRFAFLLIIT